jgi:NlpC/P60 family
VTGPEADAAAQLLERLLTDPGFRDGFRRDPVATSRDAGVESLAEEIALGAGAGKAMDTLDVRESRSSLAGVFMAAALEGVGGYDFLTDFAPHLEGIPASVGQVLSRVDLPAVLPSVEVARADTPSYELKPATAQRGEFKAITPEDLAPADGGGSGVQADPAVELLHNKRVTFDATGIADVKAGRIDPRELSILEAISRKHTISISAMRSDHDRLTSGGSVSNHYYGRAVDIAVVDGQPVSPGNQAAREVAESLSRLPLSIRPTEIGSPWALSGPAYFTDGAHQNHIHIGFDDPIPGGWKPPDGVAASEAVAAPDDLTEESDDDDDDEGADEPGGLEDPGGDTDAEADAESDGDDDDNDSVADDASDEEEDDEGDEGDEDDGADEDDGSDEDDAGDEDDGSAGNSDFQGDPGIDLGDVDGAYPGDDAPQAEIAAWMGGEAQRRGIPPELPVMAGLVESGLRNLDGGDADSAGFFQMRLGVWNNGDYKGYPDRADLQLKWFLDTAEAVKKQRIAAGRPVDDPGGYGEWIADVERPAEQYRGRYQLRLEEARGLLRRSAGQRQGGGGGQGAGAELDVFGADGARSAGPGALAAVATAKEYLGTPYRWGGSTPQTGFDCSGLVQWAYAKAGIRLPRTSEQQILAPNGRPVDRRHLIPGDLVFFRDSSGDVHHVGISLGGDKFINAPHTGDVVKVASLKEPYYAQQFTGGRRFDLGAARGAAVASGATPRDVDPAAVEDAEAALARDAAEVQRPGTLLFEAVKAQELRKTASGMP